MKPRVKLYIQTHGCQMNEYDSARMADVLAASDGLELTDQVEEADVILVNPSSIREKQHETVFSQLGLLRPLKQAVTPVLLRFGGIVRRNDRAATLQRAPFVALRFR